MSLNIEIFSNVLPEMRDDIERYNHLLSVDNRPRIAVFGKFNHGKSTLLNALAGNEIFAASDKRETVKNKEYADEVNNVIWLDTPGLDADPTKKDDNEANIGVLTSADIILLVHNLNTGELDKDEYNYFNILLENTPTIKKLLVLTQLDQVNTEHQKLAIQKIKEQFPNFDVFPVSAMRYQKGINLNKHEMIKRSGILELKEYITTTRGEVFNSREKNKVNIIKKISENLEHKHNEVNNLILEMKSDIKNKRNDFIKNIDKLFKKIQSI